MSKKANVCYLHRQKSNQWEWFLSDTYGRQLVKSGEKFNNFEEAQMDYNLHYQELEDRLVIRDQVD